MGERVFQWPHSPPTSTEFLAKTVDTDARHRVQVVQVFRARIRWEIGPPGSALTSGMSQMSPRRRLRSAPRAGRGCSAEAPATRDAHRASRTNQSSACFRISPPVVVSKEAKARSDTDSVSGAEGGEKSEVEFDIEDVLAAEIDADAGIDSIHQLRQRYGHTGGSSDGDAGERYDDSDSDDSVGAAPAPAASAAAAPASQSGFCRAQQSQPVAKAKAMPKAKAKAAAKLSRLQGA